MSRGPLPDDVPALKHIIACRDELIDQLTTELTRLRRWRFGSSSEKMQPVDGQSILPLDEQAAAANDPGEQERIPEQDSTEHAPSSPRGKRGAARGRGELPLGVLPDHLPRVTITHEPASCTCPACGHGMRRLGEDIAEQLDWVPGYLRALRHVRPKHSCGNCAKIVQLPAPPRPIERGLPTPALLAQVLVSKYCDHQPMYRQSVIFRRHGVEVLRSTLVGWAMSASTLVSPLVGAVSRYVLQPGKVHTDDTPVPVLDPGRGRTKTGRLWTYVRDDRPAGSRAPPAVWYRFSPDRKSIHPQEHLKGFTGVLQADAYAGYESIYADGTVLEAACMAHLRRKFYDVWKDEGSPIAAEAIRRIAELYRIERRIRGKLPAERRLVRRQESAPLLRQLHDWMSDTLRRVSTKSKLAEAFRYGLVRWTSFERFIDDGRIEIDNNTAERSIRPLVLGRRNYLFAGSDAGGEAAANIYTLIGSATLNGVEPYAYLKAVFERIAEHPINRVDELLPWNIDLAQGSAHNLRSAA
jgi:transposase